LSEKFIEKGNSGVCSQTNNDEKLISSLNLLFTQPCLLELAS